MQRKVSFIHLELSWLQLFLVTFQAVVSNLCQLIEFYKELSQHLFLDGFLIGPHAFNLVPQLDLQGLPKGLLNLLLVHHVYLNEI